METEKSLETQSRQGWKNDSSVLAETLVRRLASAQSQLGDTKTLTRGLGMTPTLGSLVAISISGTPLTTCPRIGSCCVQVQLSTFTPRRPESTCFTRRVSIGFLHVFSCFMTSRDLRTCFSSRSVSLRIGGLLIRSRMSHLSSSYSSSGTSPSASCRIPCVQIRRKARKSAVREAFMPLKGGRAAGSMV
jgi:hypothetical protein